jgi:hypothetical protein
VSLESIKQELTDLLAHLLQIGRDSPELLMFLGQLIANDDWSEVREPQKNLEKKKVDILCFFFSRSLALSQSDRYSLISQMFDDVPRILDDALRHARDQFLRIISATQRDPGRSA